jgi:hypothetical protein
MLNSRGGLLETIHAALEVADFIRIVCEPERLADVDLLGDRCIHERSVDVELTKFEVLGGSNGEEKAEASHADNRGEIFRVVNSSMLAASFGHEASFEARHFSFSV